jgi:DNA-binding transcriptional regulator YiaG
MEVTVEADSLEEAQQKAEAFEIDDQLVGVNDGADGQWCEFDQTTEVRAGRVSFGAYLKDQRGRLGLTQGELVERTAGTVSQSSLSHYEAGRKRPAHAGLVALLGALGVNGIDRAVALTVWASPLGGE